MKPKVYITRKLPSEVVYEIEQHCDINMWEEEDVPVPQEVLEENIKDIDGLYCLLTETIDDSLLQKATKLKVISNMAVGFNNIDVEAATKRGIAVLNTPGVLTETTADLTFALLMATARRLFEAEFFLRDGNWKTWSPMLLTGQDIHGATIGIVGLGRIGEAVARRAKGFGMKILYHNRSRKPDVERELDVEYVEFDDLLRKSDYVVLLTPYTHETKNLISSRELALMKKTSILINTSRGGIVNEAALYDSLQSGVIWGAGLDVFEEEPVSLDHPLLQLPQVVALPHIGSASIQTRLKMARLATDNLVQLLKGKKPEYIVNPNFSENITESVKE
ncbi:2-hydroxyacid dehydrogenase [Bacillus alkalicellulosilyticus]|uniref:2-hydroxyacid dehydrogenase n=1 Tax=Alkalihalobacterium alkalicellulosilyticum TaxID=1912214 RepID=UPI000996BB86|nr:D-glycerate dehydrogenase [Bacillus alkalicellulosilyticus]